MRKAIIARVLTGMMCAAVAACAASSPNLAGGAGHALTAAQTSADSIVLLGTSGGPLARPDRAGIATLLAISGKTYLIDAGEGVVHQLGKAGMQPAALSAVFLTHLHDDHYVGLPAAASFAWTLRGSGLDIYGPKGTEDLVKGIWQVMGPNARIRMAEQQIARKPEQFVAAHEYAAGQIFDDANVRVLALANSHYDLPPGTTGFDAVSYSLRFESGGRTIVFTGDTGPSSAVAEFAKGADVLVAEMASLEDREAVPPYVRPHMDREHLSPLEVGKLAAAAGVKTLVLTHIGMVGEADLAVIRSLFSGKILVGTDMARIAL